MDRSPKGIPEIVRFIAQTIEELSLGEKKADLVAPGDRLIEDIGLDSLDYATVLLSCEKWLGIKVREDAVDWLSVDTVLKLASFLEQQQR
jgi:acyl carrier protein